MKTYLPLVLFLGLGTFVSLPAAEVRFDNSNNKEVKVFLDGEHFTTYLYRYGQKPIFWPIYGPDHTAMTREYPMRDPNAKKFPFDSFDHIHHRSLWFTHGSVNGVDFWSEFSGSGFILHRKFVKLEAPVMVTRNDWMDRDENIVLEDERTMTFGADAQGRWIDFEICLMATRGEVKFGDTKEGSFGLRVPGVLDVDKKQGGKIVNAEGLVNADAWGKQSAWVDYHGTLNGKPAGIAIMNHPTSARFPTYWHVRTYGLFAANPFGVRDFTGDESQNGTLLLKKGESVTFKYRVYFHRGDQTSGNVAENFQQYAGKIDN
ncbi:MAG: PmoA family protein [Planctomycetia bacterium]|nr:PmoA family protein [Planctomycetia bacterium]